MCVCVHSREEKTRVLRQRHSPHNSVADRARICYTLAAAGVASRGSLQRLPRPAPARACDPGQGATSDNPGPVQAVEAALGALRHELTVLEKSFDKARKKRLGRRAGRTAAGSIP